MRRWPCLSRKVWRAQRRDKSRRRRESLKALSSTTSKQKKISRFISSKRKPTTLSSGFIHKSTCKERRFRKVFSQLSIGSSNILSPTRISSARFSFGHYNQLQH